jgi:tetratricopeptide (TPR) repeat protein
MENDLEQKSKLAISAALNGNWQEALKLNQEILKENPEDVEALTRLARAYSELGNIKEAKSTAEKVLLIDPYNTIAQKCLKKWKKIKSKSGHTNFSLKADLFIEEPGKTKIVPLVYVSNPKTVAKLDTGDEIKLNLRGHRINVTTIEGEYLGRLPDDINSRLKRLMELGNIYQAFIKSIDNNEVKIFIKEVKKSRKAEKIPSFTLEKINYVSFTPPDLVHNKEDFLISENEEMEE